MHNQVPSGAVDTAAWLTVALTALLPSIDGNALIGAFCGAAIYTLRSVETGLMRKSAYMLLSIVLGYAFAGSVQGVMPAVGTGPAALAISMLVVTAGGTLIDWLRTLDVSGLIARLFGRG